MWISLYNCPSADDFNYSVRTYTAWKESHSIGQLLGAALDTSVHFWKTWQGLYSSAFLLSLQPAIFSGEAYAVTGIIMMILIGGSTIFFSCYIMKTIFKRRIDKSNQDRTDLVELIDSYFLDKYKDVSIQENATINTESPAWAIDRLSILALKIYHMRQEVERTDTTPEHHAQCETKLNILLEQQKDLSSAIDQLIEDIEAGRKYMKVYKQMKMYNDPNLNPVLYGKK